jgi:hypothetical protein
MDWVVARSFGLERHGCSAAVWARPHVVPRRVGDGEAVGYGGEEADQRRVKGGVG